MTNLATIKHSHGTGLVITNGFSHDLNKHMKSKKYQRSTPKQKISLTTDIVVFPEIEKVPSKCSSLS